MCNDSVYGSHELTEPEWQLVDRAKRTLLVLAKVIQHTELSQVKKDIDPNGQMDEGKLERLARQHLTPDLLNLDDTEEALVIAQLGAAIFSELTTLEEDG
jgi:hypothetical protein